MREQHGFNRTMCDCALCRVPCRHVPGGLDVADLERLCPVGEDVFAWAEQHLRARADKSYPSLVPARRADGQCHWYFDGGCAVHEHAPYGCAFFDCHMSEAEVRRRYAATVAAREQDAVTEGLYTRVWRHLCAKGLTDTPGDPATEYDRLRREAERNRRRAMGH